jgi:hypothetical protein
MKPSLPMSGLRWLVVSGAAVAWPFCVVLPARAQSCPPQPCPAPQAAQPSAAQPSAEQPSAQANQDQQNQQANNQNLPPERGAAVGNETVAQALIGGGGAQAGAVAGGGILATPRPLILPGLFTAAVVESAQPADRIFTEYGYFSGFRVTSPLGFGGSVMGFNLNYWDFGVEKAFFDGRASIVLHVPVLDATANSTGIPIDGFGDITAGIKVAVLRDCETGTTLSAGMLVSAPTARNEVFTTDTTTVPATTTTVNPTFLQPFVAGVAVLDNFFVQDYFAVVIPTDGRVSTFLNNDFNIGYRLYRCDSGDRLLTSITPTLDVQTLLPVNHRGVPGPLPLPAGVPASVDAGTFGFPDQLFLTEGVQLGIGERAVISGGIVEPLMGPKAFTIGFTMGFNLYF